MSLPGVFPARAGGFPGGFTGIWAVALSGSCAALGENVAALGESVAALAGSDDAFRTGVTASATGGDESCGCGDASLRGGARNGRGRAAVSSRSPKVHRDRFVPDTYLVEHSYLGHRSKNLI